MKKKLLGTILALICALCCVFGFTGCDMLSGLFGGSGSNETPDDKGRQDMSFNQSVLNLEVGQTADLYISEVKLSEKEFIESGYCPRGEWSEMIADGYTDQQIMARIMSGLADWSSDNARIASVDYNPEASEAGQSIIFTVFANSEGTTYIRACSIDKKHQAVCEVNVKDPNKKPDPEKPDPEKPDPEKPGGSVENELVFEFYDITSEDGYPYLDSMKTGMRGQTMTFKTDGTAVSASGSYTVTGTYVKNGNTFAVTISGITQEYFLEDGVISVPTELSGYHLTIYFKLKGEDKYDELAGKTFRYVNVTSDLLDANQLQSIKEGYKYATVSFAADGSFELYNPSDGMDTNPNAYSIQKGTFTCTDGDGYMTVTYMWAGGEVVDIVTATYALTLDGNNLTLSAGGMIFTYSLVTD